MIVLVPLSRFRISYEVAAGRPFSQFERLILRAIKEGASELSVLRKTFQVHPRLLIEGLVTLTHAGWLAIGGPGHEGFVLTSGGHEAATSDQPPSTTEVTSRYASVVMERISGALIANNEIRFASRRELKDVWEQAVRLSSEVTTNQLDEGQVQHLLPRRQGEWLRWIGPIDMLTKDTNWLPVDVDTQSDNVVGLPDSWVPRLQTAIVERARTAAEMRSEKETVRTAAMAQVFRAQPRATGKDKDASSLQLPGSFRSALLSEDNFLFTFLQHENLLEEALNEAQSSIFIASPCPNIDKLEHLRDDIMAAVSRGVNVDLLYGATSHDSQEFRAIIDWSSKVAYEAKRENVGTLRFGRQPSDLHGNLLLWDGRGRWWGCVGSYKWLSISEEHAEIGFPRDVSVRISEPGIVAALARCAIGFWSGVDTEMLSSTADRWRGIAAEQDMVASRVGSHETNTNVSLILDGEHEALLGDFRSIAQSKVLVASCQLDSVKQVLGTDHDIDEPEAVGVDVVYGCSEKEQEWLAELSRRVAASGGSLRQVHDFRGEILIGDESACVTSYNILGSSSDGGSKSVRNIGIVIEGKELIHWLRRKFDTA